MWADTDDVTSVIGGSAGNGPVSGWVAWDEEKLGAEVLSAPRASSAVAGEPSVATVYGVADLSADLPDLPWGSMGENLTLAGLTEQEMYVGDVLRIGGRHLDAGGYGALMMCFGAGALSGALAIAGAGQLLPRGQMLTISSLGMGIAIMVFAAMVYGPMAAMLVEMFPARIRYTSMSLPYHIGNGWFGGLMPTIAFAMVAQNCDMYYGLWYPIVIASVTFVIGLLFVRETKDVDIYAGD